jgi:hypothetical protein
MKNRVLIDTSGWICFFARRGYEDMKKAISILLDEDRVAIAGPILAELIQGARDIEEKQNIQDYAKGLYPVRNNTPLLGSGDENYSFYSFFSEHGVQSPV